MQFKTFVAAAVAVAVPAVEAIGQAKLYNNCPFPLYFWAVGKDVFGPGYLFPQGGVYGETFLKDPVTGGKALKITKTPDGLYTGQPQTVFAYNLDGGQIWYDLSDVFGDPFAGYKVVASSSQATCPSITWGNGIPPAGSQVKVCTAEADVTLTLCAA